jgi:xylan 1,4-beta-xylosidase
MMSFWTFSDVFEEGGPKREPFDGGFGLIAMGGIKKPSYAGFALLHQLGDEQISQEASNVLVTRRHDGVIAVAAWNLVDPGKTGGPISIAFKFSGLAGKSSVRITRVDSDHRNTQSAYKAMGSPAYPTREQVRALNKIAEDVSPENMKLSNDEIQLKIPVNGLVLMELMKP